MRTRLVLPLALVALLGLVAPACGDGGGSDQAAKTSPERPTTTVKKGSSDNGDSSSKGDSGSGDSGTTVPNLDDLAKDLGVDQLGTCLDLATDYGSLYFVALGGEEGAKKALDTAEDLKKNLPDDLHDDIDVIAEAIGTVAKEGLLSGTDALSTPEYKKADKAITTYLNTTCGADSGGSSGNGSGGNSDSDTDTDTGGN